MYLSLLIIILPMVAPKSKSAEMPSKRNGGARGPGLLTYDDSFSLGSGFGDRFSAWLALFTLAHLRNEHVLLTTRLWANTTVSREKQQIADIQQALGCLLLPSLVARDDALGFKSWRKVVKLNLRNLFSSHKTLPRATPGFPQWAIPILALKAFKVASLLPSNISQANFIAAYREVSALISVAPHCEPRLSQIDAVALGITHIQQRPGGEDTMSASSSKALTAALAEPAPPDNRQLLICIHIRRRDAWDFRIVHGKGRFPIYSAEAREKHTRVFKASLLRIAKLLLAATAVNTSITTGALVLGDKPPTGRVTWLILSDSANSSADVARLLRDLPTEVNAAAGVASPLFLPKMRRWRVITAPPGFMVWSFLTMRRASGIIQSALRVWSSFSAVPALMGDVPLFSIQGSDSNKGRPVPHDQGLMSQYTAHKAEEEAFVARVLQGPLPAVDPAAGHVGKNSSLVSLVGLVLGTSLNATAPPGRDPASRWQHGGGGAPRLSPPSSKQHQPHPGPHVTPQARRLSSSTSDGQSPNCIAPGLDFAARQKAREALTTVLCSPPTALSPPSRHVAERPAATVIQDPRRRLAGFGSALNVYLSSAIAQLRANQSFDGSMWRLRSSQDLDYGSGIRPARCKASTLPCLFAAVACEPKHVAATVQERANGFAALRKAHPYALIGSLVEVTLSPNSWLSSLAGAVEQQAGPVDIAIHLRRGDKLAKLDRSKLDMREAANASDVENATRANATRAPASLTSTATRAKNRGDSIVFVNESVVSRLVAGAAARFNLSSVLIISDDDDAPRALARLLPSHLRVTTIVQGTLAKDDGAPLAVHRSIEADGRLKVRRMDGMEVGAFLFSAMWSMARARVVVANSGSNLGNFIMSLAGVRTAFEPTPYIIDLDSAVSTKDLFHGKYLCTLAPAHGTPAHYGVCGSRIDAAQGEDANLEAITSCWTT